MIRIWNLVSRSGSSQEDPLGGSKYCTVVLQKSNHLPSSSMRATKPNKKKAKHNSEGYHFKGKIYILPSYAVLLTTVLAILIKGSNGICIFFVFCSTFAPIIFHYLIHSRFVIVSSALLSFNYDDEDGND